jgi:hypothetical protein
MIKITIVKKFIKMENLLFKVQMNHTKTNNLTIIAIMMFHLRKITSLKDFNQK